MRTLPPELQYAIVVKLKATTTVLKFPVTFVYQFFDYRAYTFTYSGGVSC